MLENEVDMMNINMHHQLIKCLIGPILYVRGLLVNNIIPIIQKIVADNEVNAKKQVKTRFIKNLHF